MTSYAIRNICQENKKSCLAPNKQPSYSMNLSGRIHEYQLHRFVIWLEGLGKEVMTFLCVTWKLLVLEYLYLVHLSVDHIMLPLPGSSQGRFYF
jgi:hypothetical protein